jgi:AcrR family transcriptional regulator
MNTKKLIKQKTIELFSKKGIRNVTLREIAKELNKSYGNITYHYKNKEELIKEITINFLKNIEKLNSINFENENSLINYFKFTELQFSITKKYFFFFVDYLEIKRNYPLLEKRIELNTIWSSDLKLEMLNELQQQGYLQKNLNKNSFLYILEIQSALSIQYLQNSTFSKMNKKEYTQKINKSIFPYLTDKGKIKYIKA